MLNKLSRKDIELLNILAQTPEGKSALDEYIEQHEKAVKAYKVYRESVVTEVEVDKVVKSVETKRKFKAGDKVRVLDVSYGAATSALAVGDITEVVGYKEDFEGYKLLAPKERPVVVAEPEGETGLFEESALELVVEEEKSPNELRAEIIEKAKEFVKKCRSKKMVVRVDDSRSCVFGVSFIVNAGKRTVVALLRGVISDSVRAKGIAKCRPGDVFNEHIGKAIALGRALGKDVSEFENAVQPDEIVVGQEVKTFDFQGNIHMTGKVEGVMRDEELIRYHKEDYEKALDFVYTHTSTEYGFEIIDDTKAIYKEATD